MEINPQLIKIVTVEDSIMITERLRVLLSDLSNVDYLGNARNVDSALLLVKTSRPHVVILDIILDDHSPLNSGIRLLGLLKKKYSSIVVMMLTNLIDDSYRTKCRSLGADYFFDKSNDFNKIPTVLSELNLQDVRNAEE